ncbi:MAG: hypothetical protein ABI885_06385 [Gammaproteobacteria bacterium]
MGEAARSVFSASISLLAGYSFIRLSYYRRYVSEYLRTDRYSLHVLGYSFVFFIVGDVIAEFMPHWTPQALEHVVAGLAATGITAPVINAIGLGLLVAVLDNFRVRWLMRDDAALGIRSGFLERVRFAAVARFVRKSNDSSLRVIFRATVLQKSLMVTLKSHKVYVGKPYQLHWEDPTQSLTFIKILPEKSGYRDPVTKQVKLPTRYDALGAQLVELDTSVGLDTKDVADPLASDVLGLVNPEGEVIAHIDVEDLGVVIAWAEVVSLSIYDEDLYNAFQAQR